MKTLRLVFLLAVVLSPSAQAFGTRFFRVVGPAASTITGIGADGYITWTNAATNGTFTVQMSQSLPGGANWVDYLQVSVASPVTTHSFYAYMALIPAGSFTMGATTNMGHDYYLDEIPQHPVPVSALYMDQYKVTKALWDEVYHWATNQGYVFDNRGSACSWPYEPKPANHPVNCLNWYDTVKWCNARSEKDGRTACYYTDAEQTEIYKSGQLDLTNGCVKWEATGYRLPTEAEWEKAARGGTGGHRFPWSDVDTINQNRANYFSYWEDVNPFFPYDVNPTQGYHTNFNDGEFPLTNPLGFFPANGYGLYDMAGNVWDFCWDWYDANWYTNAAALANDTRGPDGASSSRVRRGGSWDSDASNVRCAERDETSPASVENTVGFRCVRRF